MLKVLHSYECSCYQLICAFFLRHKTQHFSKAKTRMKLLAKKIYINSILVDNSKLSNLLLQFMLNLVTYGCSHYCILKLRSKNSNLHIHQSDGPNLKKIFFLDLNFKKFFFSIPVSLIINLVGDIFIFIFLKYSRFSMLC